jgi:hypothetical protein
MKFVKIREMEKSEIPIMQRWVYEHRAVNQVDWEVFRRGQVRIYAAENEFGVICYIPVRIDYHFDALGPRPGVASSDLASAFAAMNEFLDRQAKEAKVISRIWVQPSDGKFSKFIQKHFGYKLVTRETLEKNLNEVQESAKCG